MVRHRLRPCLCSLAQIAVWRESGEGSPAALHIDTGINRLGLPPDELAELAADRTRLRGVEIALVLSHLACGDDPEHPLNRRQLEDFRRGHGGPRSCRPAREPRRLLRHLSGAGIPPRSGPAGGLDLRPGAARRLVPIPCAKSFDLKEKSSKSVALTGV